MEFPAETLAFWKKNKEAIEKANQILNDAGLPTYTQLKNASKDLLIAINDQEINNSVVTTYLKDVRDITNQISTSTI